MSSRQATAPATTRRRSPSGRADPDPRSRITLEGRIAVLETLVQLQAQRLIAMQAQLDHVAGRGRS
jgi:hypothetical protein